MESNDFEEDFHPGDSDSVSSGDSVLIGVEDQQEFNMDVDMDLYNKLARNKVKTLDDVRMDWGRGDRDNKQGGGTGNPLYHSDDDETDF